MKAIVLMFDSLNRHMLSPYGCDWTHTPNFQRLAERAATFDRAYIGSMPCMPARRELHTGRYNFLHRSWGPLEPFDDSMPELLKKNGVYTHLVTDHYHYWEDGGMTYHNRYDSYEFIRGQEGDAWKAMVQPPWERLREMYHERQVATGAREYFRYNIVNREFIREEKDFPAVQCFAHGHEFLDLNRDADNWLLQIETFDPHEPFHAPLRFRNMHRTGWNGPVRDWPRYGRVDELPEECDELRANYYALVQLCDSLLGELLDRFDREDMWKDTALVVTTDHGFLLGEHDFWAKNRMNMYEEIVHIPLFVHDPRHPQAQGRRCAALTQTMDIAATMLDFFGVAPPAENEGLSLLKHLDGEQPGRKAAIFGYFGGAVNVTDGRYTYHRYPFDLLEQEIYQYTVMPTHMKQLFTTEELAAATLSAPLPFSKGVPLLKIPMHRRTPMHKHYGPGNMIENDTRLYDLQTDPGQQVRLDDPEVERRMIGLMTELMRANHAPPEAYVRLELDPPA